VVWLGFFLDPCLVPVDVGQGLQVLLLEGRRAERHCYLRTWKSHIDKVSWRWCFYINLPIGGFTAGIITLFFKTPKAAKAASASLKEKLLQMDMLGTSTILAAVVCYLLALQYCGVTKPWSSSVVIGLLVGSVLLIIAFVALEWRMGERGIIPPRMLRQRTVGYSLDSSSAWMVASSFSSTTS